MDCKSIEHILPAYIEHAASEEEIKAVEEHLCVCHTCRALLGSIMDKPQVVSRRSPAPDVVSEKESFLFEYIIMGISVIILFFFILLFIKG